MWGAPIDFEAKKYPFPAREGVYDQMMDAMSYLAAKGPSENRSYFNTLVNRRKRVTEGFQGNSIADLRALMDKVNLFKLAAVTSAVQLPATACLLDSQTDLSNATVAASDNITVFEPLIPRAIKNEGGKTNLCGIGSFDNNAMTQVAGIFKNNMVDLSGGYPPLGDVVGRTFNDADVLVGSAGSNTTSGGVWTRNDAYQAFDMNRGTRFELFRNDFSKSIRIRFKDTVTVDKIMLLRGNLLPTFSLSVGNGTFNPASGPTASGPTASGPTASGPTASDTMSLKQSWNEPLVTNGVFVTVTGGATGRSFSISLEQLLNVAVDTIRPHLIELQFYRQTTKTQADAITFLSTPYTQALTDIEGTLTAAQRTNLVNAMKPRVLERITDVETRYTPQAGNTNYSMPSALREKIDGDRRTMNAADTSLTTMADIYGSYRSYLDSSPQFEINSSAFSPCMAKSLENSVPYAYFGAS